MKITEKINAYLNEEKKKNFNTLVKKYYTELNGIDDFKDKFKKKSATILTSDVEEASFTLYKGGKISVLSNYKSYNIKKEREDVFGEYYKTLKFIAYKLGIDYNIQIKDYFRNSFIIVEMELSGVNKDGINVNVLLKYAENVPFSEHWTETFYGTDIIFSFKGNKLDNIDTEYDICPEMIPDTILVGSYGYDMTLARFYKIVRRSKNTIYIRELENRITQASSISSDGKILPIPNKFSDNEIYRKILKPGDEERFLIKIDGIKMILRIWNGKEVIYNEWD